ncbi:uncharacterized protein BDR25DRAFT_353086 [Lindgomyces ingoldianus]|uniref:Uncharacterized protein n=1 Tax=Lindgomyces ingoldianus TaxID=673940 RepID=A0ACB6R359_9PLEO|nr:uncharacterized protein BDR25DRAFT_353086 [Lindgomyces ingoldianus]KAF2472762.1 hypothetical protein BDR25DRAFT_353086 [Lindgomyces ingoldianus]
MDGSVWLNWMLGSINIVVDVASTSRPITYVELSLYDTCAAYCHLPWYKLQSEFAKLFFLYPKGITNSNGSPPLIPSGEGRGSNLQSVQAGHSLCRIRVPFSKSISPASATQSHYLLFSVPSIQRGRTLANMMAAVSNQLSRVLALLPFSSQQQHHSPIHGEADGLCQPFRFMDLPKDIRLMVYERLPREIVHHALRPLSGPFKGNNQGVVLIYRATPTLILATCQEVYHEAKAIIGKSISWVHEGGVKLLTSLGGSDRMVIDIVMNSLLMVYDRRMLQEGPINPDLEAIGIDYGGEGGNIDFKTTIEGIVWGGVRDFDRLKYPASYRFHGLMPGVASWIQKAARALINTQKHKLLAGVQDAAVIEMACYRPTEEGTDLDEKEYLAVFDGFEDVSFRCFERNITMGIVGFVEAGAELKNGPPKHSEDIVDGMDFYHHTDGEQPWRLSGLTKFDGAVNQLQVRPTFCPMAFPRSPICTVCLPTRSMYLNSLGDGTIGGNGTDLTLHHPAFPLSTVLRENLVDNNGGASLFLMYLGGYRWPMPFDVDWKIVSRPLAAIRQADAVNDDVSETFAWRHLNKTSTTGIEGIANKIRKIIQATHQAALCRDLPATQHDHPLTTSETDRRSAKISSETRQVHVGQERQTTNSGKEAKKSQNIHAGVKLRTANRNLSHDSLHLCGLNPSPLTFVAARKIKTLAWYSETGVGRVLHCLRAGTLNGGLKKAKQR